MLNLNKPSGMEIVESYADFDRKTVKNPSGKSYDRDYERP